MTPRTNVKISIFLVILTKSELSKQGRKTRATIVKIKPAMTKPTRNAVKTLKPERFLYTIKAAKKIAKKSQFRKSGLSFVIHMNTQRNNRMKMTDTKTIPKPAIVNILLIIYHYTAKNAIKNGVY